MRVGERHSQGREERTPGVWRAFGFRGETAAYAPHACVFVVGVVARFAWRPRGRARWHGRAVWRGAALVWRRRWLVSDALSPPARPSTASVRHVCMYGGCLPVLSVRPGRVRLGRAVAACWRLECACEGASGWRIWRLVRHAAWWRVARVGSCESREVLLPLGRCLRLMEPQCYSTFVCCIVSVCCSQRKAGRPSNASAIFA